MTLRLYVSRGFCCCLRPALRLPLLLLSALPSPPAAAVSPSAVCLGCCCLDLALLAAASSARLSLLRASWMTILSGLLFSFVPCSACRQSTMMELVGDSKPSRFRQPRSWQAQLCVHQALQQL